MLIAEQSAPSTLVFGTISVVLCGGVAIYMLLHRKWGLGLSLFFLTLALTLLAKPGPAYRITVDRSENKIEWETIRGGRQVSHSEVASADLASADMEFNRDSRCIVLIHKDGTQSYPLGRQHFSDEPEQYVVLNAIRQLIGQTALQPASQ